jgi:AcrR family transcriptional regulator
LEVAYDLFAQNGFHGTSMRQIADVAGVAVSGMYNHFSTKDEIFAAVLDAYHPYHVILPALESIEGETVEALIREAARRVHDGLTSAQVRFLPLIFIELVEFQGRHLTQLIEKVLPTLRDFAQRLTQRQGRLRPHPPLILFRTFMAMLVGYFLSDMLLQATPLFRKSDLNWYGGMVDIYLHGILEPED